MNNTNKYTGDAFLQHLNEARKLNRWIYDYIEQYLGESVLEVGCGIGNITEFLVADDRLRLTAIDIEPSYVEAVTGKFAARGGFQALVQDITSPGLVASLGAEAFDTIVCLNVLEHIQDDRATLRYFHDLLHEKGRLALLCPAHPCLFGSMDRDVGHYRRYERDKLEFMLKETGFKVIRSFYFNSFNVLGWWFNGKVLGSRHASPLQIRLVEAVVPLLRFWEDRVKLPFGLSILVIAEK